MNKNQILNVEGDSQTLEIRTSEGLTVITEAEIIEITKGIIPTGLKNKKELEGISFKTLKQEIAKVISKRNNKKNEEPPTIFKTRFSLSGKHYAEIRKDGNYQFIVYGHEGTITYTKETEAYDDDGNRVIIRPAPQIAQQKLDKIFENDSFEFLKFPPGPINYVSEYELYLQIRNFIHRYTQVKEEDEILLPLWVMKGTLFDMLKETSFPLIHIIAPYGKGKSRLLQTMTEITPYGFYLINLSAAPLKRVSQLYAPILYVDEKGNIDSETNALVNAKFNRNTVYLNADKEIQRGFSALIGYKLYGPMAMAGRTPFRDDAIESKSFQIDQNFELTREDIPRKIKGEILEEFEQEGLEIRGKLLQFRINWCEKINSIQSSKFLQKYESHLEPRLFEIISFFEDIIEIIPELKVDFAKMLEYQIIRNVEVAKDTANGLIASTLLSIISNGENTIQYEIGGKGYTGIYLSKIYEEVGQNYAKQAGKILSALGLRTERPRIKAIRKGKNDNEEEYWKRISVVRLPEETKLKELKQRYDPEFVREELARISQNNQTSLDDEDKEDYEKANSTPEKKLDNEDDEDKEKGYSDEKINEKIKKEPSMLNDSPHSPLSPRTNSNTAQEPEKSDVLDITDTTSSVKGNQKNNSSEDDDIPDSDFGTDFYRIKIAFQYEFEKDGRTIKVNCKEGQVRKLSNKTAILYRAYLEKACSNGHWDPNEKQCIVEDNGGEPHE